MTEKQSEAMIAGIQAGSRQHAARVCEDKANRLRRRAEGYDILARLIDRVNLSEEEEGKLWSLVTFSDRD